jgi:hypothetical protein
MRNTRIKRLKFIVFFYWLQIQIGWFLQLLPRLCQQIQSKNPVDRHGAVFAVSSLLEALADRHNGLIIDFDEFGRLCLP